MSEMIDQEAKEIAAQAIAQLVRDSLGSIFEGVSSVVNVQKGQFVSGFSEYCSHMYQKNSQIRTLHSKNAPVPLSEIYVESRFLTGNAFVENEEFSESELVANFFNGQRIIVKGNGGSGKTVFLKHLWISLLEKKKQKIPVYVGSGLIANR